VYVISGNYAQLVSLLEMTVSSIAGLDTGPDADAAPSSAPLALILLMQVNCALYYPVIGWLSSVLSCDWLA
jgi:hypothetical protein